MILNRMVLNVPLDSNPLIKDWQKATGTLRIPLSEPWAYPCEEYLMVVLIHPWCHLDAYFLVSCIYKDGHIPIRGLHLITVSILLLRILTVNSSRPNSHMPKPWLFLNCNFCDILFLPLACSVWLSTVLTLPQQLSLQFPFSLPICCRTVWCCRLFHILYGCGCILSALIWDGRFLPLLFCRYTWYLPSCALTGQDLRRNTGGANLRTCWCRQSRLILTVPNSILFQVS